MRGGLWVSVLASMLVALPAFAPAAAGLEPPSEPLSLMNCVPDVNDLIACTEEYVYYEFEVFGCPLQPFYPCKGDPIPFVGFDPSGPIPSVEIWVFQCEVLGVALLLANTEYVCPITGHLPMCDPESHHHDPGAVCLGHTTDPMGPGATEVPIDTLCGASLSLWVLGIPVLNNFVLVVPCALD